jgi:hypothetical protein
MLSVHWADAASEEPQVSVKAKSPPLGPVTWMLEMLKDALPVFVNMAL